MLMFDILEFLPVGENQVAVIRGVHTFDNKLAIMNTDHKHLGMVRSVDVKYLAYKDITDEHLALRHVQSMSVAEYRAGLFEKYPAMEVNEIFTVIMFNLYELDA